MKKTAIGIFQPRNHIEDVIAFLSEVGKPLSTLQNEIFQEITKISDLQRELTKTRATLREKRSETKVMITRNYTESEVETADVMATRKNY